MHRYLERMRREAHLHSAAHASLCAGAPAEKQGSANKPDSPTNKSLQEWKEIEAARTARPGNPAEGTTEKQSWAPDSVHKSDGPTNKALQEWKEIMAARKMRTGDPSDPTTIEGLTGKQVSSADFVNKLGNKVMGVLSNLGYSTGPTGKALGLWIEIIRTRRLPPGFIRRALDITFGSLTGVVKPLLGDVAKATAQATVQTALMAGASPEERRAHKRLARYLVANQFDTYFYPNLRPLRISAVSDMEALQRAFAEREDQIDALRQELAERRKQIDGEEEDDGWDEPEEDAPSPDESDEEDEPPPLPTRDDTPPPLPPRKLEETIEKAVEAAVEESGLKPDLSGEPEAPSAPVVWEKVAEGIEQAKEVVPKEDWAAAAQRAFATPESSSGGLMTLVEWALQLVTSALQGIFRNQDPAEIKQMVDAERPYAEQLAMLARDRILASPPKADKPVAAPGAKSNVVAALGVANTGVSFLSNFIGAFKTSSDMSAMIGNVLASGAAMPMRRRKRMRAAAPMEDMPTRRLLPPPARRPAPVPLDDGSDSERSWTPANQWAEAASAAWKRPPPVALDGGSSSDESDSEGSRTPTTRKRAPPVRMTPDEVPGGRRALFTGCDACGGKRYPTGAGAEPERTMTVLNGKDFLLKSGALAYNSATTTEDWIGYGDVHYDPSAKMIIHKGRGRWVEIVKPGPHMEVRII